MKVNKNKLLSRLFLLIILTLQIILHTSWFSFSTHSGMLAIPYMMNHGKVLFGDIYEQHAPGISTIAAVIQQLDIATPIENVHVLSLFTVLGISIGLYAVAKRLGGTTTAIVAVLAWFLWEPVFGNIHFYFDTVLGGIILFAVLLWDILSKRDKPRLALFVAGLLLGGSTIIKQHAWLAVAFFFLWVIWTLPKLRLPEKVMWYTGGVIVFPLITLTIVILQGNLGNYIYWNWVYNLTGTMPGEPWTLVLAIKVLTANAFVLPFFLLNIIRKNTNRELAVLTGLMWVSATILLYPRADEVHVMAMLPMTALMTGVVVETLMSDLLVHKVMEKRSLLSVDNSNIVSVGITVIIGLMWLLFCIVPYIDTPIGHGATLAYDEFTELSLRLYEIAEDDYTLFILPETDSTPQIHEISGLLPVGTWVKGWSWYFDAPGLQDQLIMEWGQSPPTLIVYFPDMVSDGHPGFQALIDFTFENYIFVDAIENVAFHGKAEIYRLTEN